MNLLLTGFVVIAVAFAIALWLVNDTSSAGPATQTARRTVCVDGVQYFRYDRSLVPHLNQDGSVRVWEMNQALFMRDYAAERRISGQSIGLCILTIRSSAPRTAPITDDTI